MLKYLFDVEFTDGTCYTQNADDRSLTEPGKRSCFYDVMQTVEKGKQIKVFTLSDGIDEYVVDLTDGHFEVNGKKFFLHNDRELKDFRLIFFRQHTHCVNVTKKEGLTPLQIQQLSHYIVYRMGWQTNDRDGKNIQHIMEIE